MAVATPTIPSQMAVAVWAILFQVSIKKLEIEVHALDRNSVNPFQIAFPVFVCVKNHVKAAVTAVIAVIITASLLAFKTALKILNAPLAPIVAAAFAASAAVSALVRTNCASINPFVIANTAWRATSIPLTTPTTIL